MKHLSYQNLSADSGKKVINASKSWLYWWHMVFTLWNANPVPCFAIMNNFNIKYCKYFTSYYKILLNVDPCNILKMIELFLKKPLSVHFFFSYPVNRKNSNFRPRNWNHQEPISLTLPPISRTFEMRYKRCPRFTKEKRKISSRFADCFVSVSFAHPKNDGEIY